MLEHLLTINGIAFPTPEGSFDLTVTDMVNEYEAENGHKTLEIIRKDVSTISVSYAGIPEAQLNRLASVIDTTNTVTFDLNGVSKTTTMQCTEKSMPKVYFGNGIYMKGLSFTLSEL